MNEIEEIGQPTWSLEEIKASYPEFKSIYSNKPIGDNVGGMKAPHAFACWFMLKQIQPKLIIESGVWKGQGTWLIEQACPKADLVCLDIDLSRLIYRSANATYIEKDFSLVNFTTYEKENSLCFFDDHQNALMRLQQMKWKGFNAAIFEDNYPKLRGDCYSLKKMFGGYGFEKERVKAGIKGSIRNLLLKIVKAVDTNRVEPNSTHQAELHNALELYYEFPPLFYFIVTRWGDKWDDANYPTKPPIFDASSEDELRSEALHYNWMCYVKLKPA